MDGLFLDELVSFHVPVDNRVGERERERFISSKMERIKMKLLLMVLVLLVSLSSSSFVLSSTVVTTSVRKQVGGDGVEVTLVRRSCES